MICPACATGTMHVWKCTIDDKVIRTFRRCGICGHVVKYE